jgi:hypothetical protein
MIEDTARLGWTPAMHKLTHVITACLMSATASGSVLDNVPDAIVCSVRDPTGVSPWEQLVFYVSARTSDERTLYKTLTSDPVVLFVDADGVIDGVNLADCDGRNISELTQEGRAIIFSANLARP